jgi:hypothetical protein
VRRGEKARFGLETEVMSMWRRGFKNGPGEGGWLGW